MAELGIVVLLIPIHVQSAQGAKLEGRHLGPFTNLVYRDTHYEAQAQAPCIPTEGKFNSNKFKKY